MSKRSLLLLVLAVFIGLPLAGLLGVTQFLSGMKGENGFANDIAPQMGTTGVVSNTMMVKPEMAADEMTLYRTEPDFSAGSAAKMTPSSTYPMPPMLDGFTPTAERLIIRTGYMNLVVKEPRETMTLISQLMSENNGFVTNSNVVNESPENIGINATMTLRVPVAQLDTVMTKLRGLAERVTSEATTASDQTEQKIDLEAQLRNLQVTEAQLIKIMSQASTVTQTLEVQRELSSVRSQIERLTAQRDNLTGNAAMATLTVNLATSESSLPIVGPQNLSLLEELKLTVRNAVIMYRQLFVNGLKLMILGLPVIILAGVVWLLGRRKPKNSA